VTVTVYAVIGAMPGGSGLDHVKVTYVCERIAAFRFIGAGGRLPSVGTIVAKVGDDSVPGTMVSSGERQSNGQSTVNNPFYLLGIQAGQKENDATE